MNKSVIIPYEKYERLLRKSENVPQTTIPSNNIQYLTPEMSESEEENDVNILPDKFRKKADKLWTFIRVHGENVIGWNDKNELIYHGEVQENTHAADLLYNAFIQRKFIPTGARVFYQGLAEINTPETLLMNPDARSEVQKFKMKKKTFSRSHIKNRVKPVWISYNKK